MSEVKRYGAAFASVNESDDGNYVLFDDFDRVTAERDALQVLLNESNELCGSLERSMKNHRHELGIAQQRLTAADERADVLEGLVREAWEYDIGMPLKRKIMAALKPAEGGSDDA